MTNVEKLGLKILQSQMGLVTLGCEIKSLVRTGNSTDLRHCKCYIVKHIGSAAYLSWKDGLVTGGTLGSKDPVEGTTYSQWPCGELADFVPLIHILLKKKKESFAMRQQSHTDLYMLRTRIDDGSHDSHTNPSTYYQNYAINSPESATLHSMPSRHSPYVW